LKNQPKTKEFQYESSNCFFIKFILETNNRKDKFYLVFKKQDTMVFSSLSQNEGLFSVLLQRSN